MKRVEITLRNNKTGQYTTLPINPAEIPYTDGGTMYNTVKVLNLGNVNFFDGVDLDSLTIAAFFPGRYDAGLCQVSQAALLSPIEYRNRLSSAKDAGATLTVVIAAFGISKTMQITSFDWVGTGADGEISYTLTLTEAKTIAPKKLSPGGVAPAKGKKTLEDRPPAAAKTTAKSYTVKQGDALTVIAKKLGIADWYGKLYLPNKAVIGKDPGKIQPGMVLKL